MSFFSSEQLSLYLVNTNSLWNIYNKWAARRTVYSSGHADQVNSCPCPAWCSPVTSTVPARWTVPILALTVCGASARSSALSYDIYTFRCQQAVVRFIVIILLSNLSFRIIKEELVHTCDSDSCGSMRSLASFDWAVTVGRLILVCRTILGGRRTGSWMRWSWSAGTR